VGAAIVLGACGGHGRAGAPASDPRVVAVRTTSDLLRRVVVPTGATVDTGALPQMLRRPFFAENTPDLVDVHRAWIVPESSAGVLAFEHAHVPRGLTASGSGTSTAESGIDFITLDATNAVSGTGTIQSAEILVAVSPRTPTTSWLRVDAHAVWRPRRDPATIVPATDRVVTVTKDGHARTITAAATVDRIEHEFNALPAAVPGTSGCGLQTDTLAVAFASSREAQPDVTATLDCGALAVTAHGHHQQLEASTAITATMG
jgi:hypothetical protein